MQSFDWLITGGIIVYCVTRYQWTKEKISRLERDVEKLKTMVQGTRDDLKGSFKRDIAHHDSILAEIKRTLQHLEGRK